MTTPTPTQQSAPLPEGFFYCSTRSRRVLHLSNDARSRYAFCEQPLKWMAGECRTPAYYLSYAGVKVCTRCADRLERYMNPAPVAAPVELPPLESVTLTELERDMLGGCYRSQYHDGGSLPSVWTWSIETRVTRQEQRAGVISSLVKKGLVSTSGAGDEGAVTVTERGAAVAERDGLTPSAAPVAE